jgi:hypothetical protein
VADFGEDDDCAFGEEITNKIPTLGARPERPRSGVPKRSCRINFETNFSNHQMCLFYADFKRSTPRIDNIFQQAGKVSSIMPDNLPSIMRIERDGARPD